MSARSRLPLVLSLALSAGLISAASAQPADTKPAEKPKSIPATGMGGGGAMKPATVKKKTVVGDPGDGKAECKLVAEPRKLDFEGTKAFKFMYMPTGAKFSAEKPVEVKKEPTYSGKPRYAVVSLGNAAPDKFVIAVDELQGEEARIYLDLNADGDLTNDQTGHWDKKQENKENGSISYQGTWVFKVSYDAGEGKTTTSDYGLNFYYSPDRDTINYYRAGARTGKISVGGAEYEVMLFEDDADGLYNKLYDPKKPQVVGEPMTKPVWLMLDGDRFNIRETFAFNDMNYRADVSADGSTLRLSPTMKVIRIPRPTERVDMLAAGVEAPDFEAIAWKSGQTQLDKGQTFKLSDFRGKKIVVLDMWATWCGPCMQGIPHLSKIAQKVQGQDVVVIALNVSDDEGAFVKFATGKGKDYHFMIARDPAGREADAAISRRLYKVTGIPATFIIDKAGKIAATVSGYRPGDTQVEMALKGLGIKID